jgi:hypothetical protein
MNIFSIFVNAFTPNPNNQPTAYMGACPKLGDIHSSHGAAALDYPRRRLFCTRIRSLVGNFIDYVPVRTFSFHGDMHTLAKGFNCSPWWIMLVLGIPMAIALVHFLVKFEPQALQWLFPESAARRGILVFLTAFILFGFYGFPGWSNSGQVSHVISAVSVCVLVPLMMIVGWWLTQTAPNKSIAGTVVLGKNRIN